MKDSNELLFGRVIRIGRRVGFAGALLAGLSGVPGACAGSSVTGTPHDLSGRGAQAGNDVCAYCHTPQSGSQSNGAAWAQRAAAADGFTLYGIRADDVPVSTPFMPPPRGVSMVCLSCHDGVTAWDALFANPSVSFAEDRQAAVLTVGSSATDHPVSVAYPATNNLAVNAPVWDGVGGLPLFRDFADGAAPDRVECGSCHNPHGGTMRKFLRGSGLCYNCHIK